jgi:thiol-disulfide isomerase/thioredoxin
VLQVKSFSLLSAVVTSLFLANLASLIAQENAGAAPQELTIGSPAPALDVEHWVQDGEGRFEKVTAFDAGKVYVIEFWATWCGPCIVSMPHLAKTQEKYADKGVQLISISDEDLETVEEFLKRPVRRIGAGAGDENDQAKPETYKDLTSVYCLTTDPDRSSSNDYLVAAGENGIPTAFIVGKDGMVEWIGHPMSMDGPLAQVVDGSWDRKAAIEQRQNEKARERMMMAVSGDLRIFAMMVDAKNYDRALEKLKKIEEKLADQPMAEQILVEGKLMVQIHVDPTAAIATLDRAVEINGDDANTLNQLTWNIYEALADSEQPNQELVKAAAGYAEKAVKQDPTNGAIIDTLAHLVYLTGDLDRAIELQTEAVKYDGGQNPSISAFLDELKAKKEESAKK